MIPLGSDTSTTTMCALFFYLTRYRKAYERLASEIRSTFNKQSDIHTGVGLNSCSYLQACIAEALRMAPATPGAPWREVQVGGAKVESIFIPAGLDVGTSIYAIHHREDMFEAPFEFRPERWMLGESGTSDETLAAQLRAYNPFSLGPRYASVRPSMRPQTTNRAIDKDNLLNYSMQRMCWTVSGLV